MNPWLLVFVASLLFFAGGVVGMVMMAALVVSKGDRFDEGYFAGAEDATEVDWSKVYDGYATVRDDYETLPKRFRDA